MTIRWRTNDAGEGYTAWTRVHRTTELEGRTFCGLAIPDWPYLMDRGDQVPDGAPRCKRCSQHAGLAIFNDGKEDQEQRREATPRT